MNLTLSFLIYFLAFSSFSTLASSVNIPLKVEVLCPHAFKTLKKSELCKKTKGNCRWKVLKSSKKATSWEKRGQFKVIENPLMKGIKIEVRNEKLSGIEVPWCFDKGVVNLPKQDLLMKIKDSKEVLYILESSDKFHLPRLSSIKHPCRKLKRIPTNKKGFSFYYLEAQALKACRAGK